MYTFFMLGTGLPDLAYKGQCGGLSHSLGYIKRAICCGNVVGGRKEGKKERKNGSMNEANKLVKPRSIYAPPKAYGPHFPLQVAWGARNLNFGKDTGGSYVKRSSKQACAHFLS